MPAAQTAIPAEPIASKGIKLCPGDLWLVHHNTERPHHSYRNMGERSIETANPCLATVHQENLIAC